MNPCQECGVDVTTVDCCHCEVVNVLHQRPAEEAHGPARDQVHPTLLFCSMACLINWGG